MKNSHISVIAKLLLLLNIFASVLISQEIILTIAEPLISFSDDPAFEPSAVVPIGDGRFLLVADDKDIKGRSLKIVDAASGKVLRTLDRFQPTDKNPKWEAMTKDDDGNYYVIGSHNHASDLEKLASRSQMYRFRLLNELESDPSKINVDTKTVSELSVKEAFAEMKLYSKLPASNKLKIEGLAVRSTSNGKQIIIGLREPSEAVSVYAATLPVEWPKPGFMVGLPLGPLFTFKAGAASSGTPYKLSSIEYVADLGGFIVLTSTEKEGPDGKPIFEGNALWFISDKTDPANPVAATQKIHEFGVGMKAEGITRVISTNANSYRFAVVFDNDAEDSKIPGALQYFVMSRKVD